MKIQTDTLSPYIQYNDLILRPDIHNNYPVTVFKPNEEVAVELVQNQAVVTTVTTNVITEYWNLTTMHTVNDQITDAVTISENKSNHIDTFVVNDTVNVVIVDEPVENNIDTVYPNVTLENNTVNQYSDVTKTKSLENNK